MLLAAACAAIATTVAAVAAIYRHEVSRGRLKDNPLHGLDMPAPRSGRDHVVGAPSAAALLHALPEQDRALWATAMYAGLRRGELRALTYMGHASITITLDTYGHMLPGNEAEAATLLNAYLDRSTG